MMLPTKVVVKVVLIYSEKLETWNVVNDENTELELFQSANEFHPKRVLT